MIACAGGRVEFASQGLHQRLHPFVGGEEVLGCVEVDAVAEGIHGLPDGICDGNPLLHIVGGVEAQKEPADVGDLAVGNPADVSRHLKGEVGGSHLHLGGSGAQNQIAYGEGDGLPLQVGEGALLIGPAPLALGLEVQSAHRADAEYACSYIHKFFASS